MFNGCNKVITVKNVDCSVTHICCTFRNISVYSVLTCIYLRPVCDVFRVPSVSRFRIWLQPKKVNFTYIYVPTYFVKIRKNQEIHSYFPLLYAKQSKIVDVYQELVIISYFHTISK